MPINTVKKISKVCDIPFKKVENYWKEAEQSALNQGISKKENKFYPYVMGILKKRIGKDCIDKLEWKSNYIQFNLPITSKLYEFSKFLKYLKIDATFVPVTFSYKDTATLLSAKNLFDIFESNKYHNSFDTLFISSNLCKIVASPAAEALTAVSGVIVSLQALIEGDQAFLLSAPENIKQLCVNAIEATRKLADQLANNVNSFGVAPKQ